MAGAPCFASDYDGTLDFHLGGGVSARDRAAIDRFREAGGLFGIDTGRTLRGITDSAAGRLPLDFYVVMSGALVLDAKREVVWERRLEREVLFDLVRHTRLRSLGLYLIMGNEYWTASPVSLVRRNRSMFSFARSLKDIPDPLYGVAFRMLSTKLATSMAAYVNRTYGDIVTAYQNGMSVDVVPTGCSKATGLDIVRRELGAGLIGSMGDSYNDIPMLQAADVGYTFAKSPEQVRGAANVLVPSVADALGDFARRAGLGGEALA